MITQPLLCRRDFLVGGASLVAMLLLTFSPLSAAKSKVPASFAERLAEVNGVRLHYCIGGKGRPVVLLHGYTQTSHMWLPIMPLLAERHSVIVPDLRGAGGSARPESGYDKKNMAVDIHELTSSLGFDRVSIVGQPGGMRRFEYFRNFEHDAKDFAELSATPLPTPVLVITGEKASGNFLIEQTKLVASNVRSVVVPGSGHWLMEEAPQAVIPAIIEFIN